MAATVDRAHPLTTTLAPAHRLRLVRSLRKISALLGETPVLDTDSRTPGLKVSTHGSIGRRRSVLRFPLRITLPSCYALPPDDGVRLPFEPLPIITPLSPLFSPPSPPTPPPWSEHDATLARRHRMVKLTRTLGERVPPALVCSSPKPTFTKHLRRASTPPVPKGLLEHEQHLTFAFAAPEYPDSRALSVRTQALSNEAVADDSADSPLGDLHVHPLSPSSSATLLSPIEALTPPWHGFASAAAPTFAAECSQADETQPTFSPLSSYENLEDSNWAVPSCPTPHASPRFQGRCEESWTGEWAASGDVDSMADVMQGLRRLRRSKSLAALGLGSW